MYLFISTVQQMTLFLRKSAVITKTLRVFVIKLICHKR